jgi:hypothetical protein
MVLYDEDGDEVTVNEWAESPPGTKFYDTPPVKPPQPEQRRTFSNTFTYGESFCIMVVIIYVIWRLL